MSQVEFYTDAVPTITLELLAQILATQSVMMEKWIAAQPENVNLHAQLMDQIAQARRDIVESLYTKYGRTPEL